MTTEECVSQGRANAVVIDCHLTRYHVVRAAACMVGWIVDDVDTEENIPAVFYGTLLPTIRRGTGSPPHPAQVIWIDKSVASVRVASLPCYQRLNHYASMNVVARKAVLFRRLMQLSRLYGSGRAARSSCDGDSAESLTALSNETNPSLGRYFSSSLPPSFSSVSDLGRLEAYQQARASSSGVNPPFFIIKPNTGCQGKGIRLTSDPLQELNSEECTDKRKECIVQLYVDRPLLLNGKKFDIRLYVLLISTMPPGNRACGAVTSAGSPDDTAAPPPSADAPDLSLSPVPPLVQGVELYVHREGLVRICAEPYATPTEANRGDAWRHLTNYAVNKMSSSFVPAGLAAATDLAANPPKEAGRLLPKLAEAGNKQSLHALAAFVESLGVAGGWPRVQRRIDECITLTMLSGIEVLRREFIGAGGVRGYRSDGRSCFELLGFDVMLRETDLCPVLMEVNHSPSLFCDTNMDFAVKSAVLRDTFRLLEICIPPWDRHEGIPKRYEACMRSKAFPPRRKQQEVLLHTSASAVDGFGFRPLLPHYGNLCPLSGTRGSSLETVEDWDKEERQAQQLMVEASRKLP